MGRPCWAADVGGGPQAGRRASYVWLLAWWGSNPGPDTSGVSPTTPSEPVASPGLLGLPGHPPASASAGGGLGAPWAVQRTASLLTCVKLGRRHPVASETSGQIVAVTPVRGPRPSHAFHFISFPVCGTSSGEGRVGKGVCEEGGACPPSLSMEAPSGGAEEEEDDRVPQRIARVW